MKQMARIPKDTEKREIHLTIKLSSSEKELLAALAADKNLTVSEFVRRRIFSRPTRNFHVTRIVNELSQNTREIKAVGRLLSSGEFNDPEVREIAMSVLIAVERAIWEIAKMTKQARDDCQSS